MLSCSLSGPLETTVDDFWRMVWEQKLPTIVMLTRLIEAAKVMCSWQIVNAVPFITIVIAGYDFNYDYDKWSYRVIEHIDEEMMQPLPGCHFF